VVVLLEEIKRETELCFRFEGEKPNANGSSH
jgi:hypothetical protein